jgi:hypothetical protein
MDESRIDDIPQVSLEENTILTSPYSEEEIWKTVFQIEHNKASGLDDFLAEFYETFWDIIKENLLNCLLNSMHGNLSCFVSILVKIFFYQNLLMRNRFSNINQYIFLMFALIFYQSGNY